MYQFNQQFIDRHLIPLIKEILTDARQGKNPYLQTELFMTGYLDEVSKNNFMTDYFITRYNNSQTPFTSQEESAEREKFVKYFVHYIRLRGTSPLERIRQFFPQQDEKTKQITWSGEVKRNVWLMAMAMTRDFEQDQVKKLINEKENSGAISQEKAEQDRKLLAQGKLILVNGKAVPKQGKFGEQLAFDEYQAVDDLKSGQSITEFGPAMKESVSMEAWETAFRQSPGDRPAGVTTVSSPTEQITGDLKQRLGVNLVNKILKQEITITSDLQFDSRGNGYVTASSGNEKMTISVNTEGAQAGTKYRFHFENGTHAGKDLVIKTEDLPKAFRDTNGALKTAREAFENLREYALSEVADSVKPVETAPDQADKIVKAGAQKNPEQKPDQVVLPNFRDGAKGINPQKLPLEIEIDSKEELEIGLPAEPGISGRLVITGLANQQNAARAGERETAGAREQGRIQQMQKGLRPSNIMASKAALADQQRMKISPQNTPHKFGKAQKKAAKQQAKANQQQQPPQAANRFGGPSAQPQPGKPAAPSRTQAQPRKANQGFIQKYGAQIGFAVGTSAGVAGAIGASFVMGCEKPYIPFCFLN